MISRDVEQPGSSPALDAGGRRFESDRPDQLGLFDEVERRQRALVERAEALLVKFRANRALAEERDLDVRWLTMQARELDERIALLERIREQVVAELP